MLILPTGGKGTGVEASGSNFPFVQPSPDIVGLLADLWLAHEYRGVVPPLRVVRMAGLQAAFDGLASAVEIRIVDATGTTVFDSAGAAYHWKPWSPRLRVHEWLFNDSVCRAVQHCAVSEPRAPWPYEIVPINGVLDERTSELMPERLTILSEKGSGVAATGEVTLVGGWNVEIVQTPYREPLRNTTALTFSADPGGGPGRYPGCQDSGTVIRTIDGIGPDAYGNFTLAADGCYYVRQSLGAGGGGKAVPLEATLLLGNDCGPCCDCDDFVNVQRSVLNIEGRLRASAAVAEATRDEFIVAKDRWNLEKECRESQPVQVVATVTARAYADINLTVCNVSDRCMVDTTVGITVTTDPPASWDVVPDTTYISEANKQVMVPYTLKRSSGEGAVVYAYVDGINPRHAGRIRFRLSWDGQRPPGTLLSVKGEAVSSDYTNDKFPATGSFYTIIG